MEWNHISKLTLDFYKRQSSGNRSLHTVRMYNTIERNLIVSM